MKPYLTAITLVLCSILIGNGIVQAVKWSEVVDLNKESEVRHINQTYELDLLRAVLFELENGNREIGIKYLKEHIEFNNDLLKSELEQGYFSDNTKEIILAYLNSETKGFEQK